MQIVVDAVILGLLVAFVVLFISRFEVREGTSIRNWVMMYAPRLVSELFGCDFCLSWWLSLAFGILFSLFFGWEFIPAAVLATPIARYFE